MRSTNFWYVDVTYPTELKTRGISVWCMWYPKFGGRFNAISHRTEHKDAEGNALITDRFEFDDLSNAEQFNDETVAELRRYTGPDGVGKPFRVVGPRATVGRVGTTV